MKRQYFRQMASPLVPLVAASMFLLTGCPGDDASPARQGGKVTAAPDDDHDHAAGAHHEHAEKGPNGGALVAIGQDDAHLEIVLDPDTGTLTAYALDGQAQESISIKQASLQLAFTVSADEEDGEEKHALPESTETLMLEAVSPAGDGSTSQFTGQAAKLKGVERFDAVITSVKIGEKSFPNITFKYPEGNEEDHHH